MAHFFVPPKNFRDKKFFFDPSESHHLSKVLRKKPGDSIRIFNGQGLIGDARILEILNESKVTGEILDQAAPAGRSAISTSRAEIRVFTAILKGPRFDWLIEKLTELGAQSIHPLLTERTVVKISAAQAASKIKRWEKIALSAAKQCGRRELPRVHPPAHFADAVRNVASNDVNIMLWESEDQSSLAEVFQKKRASLPKAPVNLFIGPEGGLTVLEAQTAIEAGISAAHLGENILRAETAAIAATAALLLI